MMRQHGAIFGRTRAMRLVVVAVFVGCFLSANPPAGRAQAPHRYTVANLKALETAFVALADKVSPSVVAIRTYHDIRVRRGGRGRTPMIVKEPVSHGSGLIIGADGYILTNYHLLDDANSLSITLFNGERYDGTVVKADRRSDLVVLKIDATGLKPVRWGTYEDVRVNQWCFAAGNPFGLATFDGRASVTYGVVSGLGRQLSDRIEIPPGEIDIRYYGNLLETSATINPGSSGGPLFNIDGRVIGIVTAIETSSGVNEGHGFAIPITKNIRRIVDQLRNGKEVRYGFIGVQAVDIWSLPPERSTAVRRNRGALIDSLVDPQSPAARAGLQPLDIVIEFDGVPVRNSDHLVRLVGFTPVGTKAEIKYLRDDVERTTKITVGDRADLLGYDPIDE
ncbi:MAG: trypsin-like peptidase domain-containing protein [Planctomycetes bacterium]|nr:trypsin-like peptidase domain-containing protein [Planctomycetota bacterium]